ncbi:hypothetical protein GALL_257540 [mine drainage metagenome]|uniref:Uncharacterized protein n=1 Tax=mine drainage metagenome TaxID=410659 RepID=A0A1J5R8H4_9ZZZZ
MIASIQFRHFKALRATGLQLQPFNLIIGPNGSGKSSLIQAILRFRNLAQLPLSSEPPGAGAACTGPELVFKFIPPFDGVEAHLCGVSESRCDQLNVSSSPPGAWDELRSKLMDVRVYLFDHYAMAMPSPRSGDAELITNGGNLAAVLAARRESNPDAYAAIESEAVRLMPEFSRIELRDAGNGKVELAMVLREDGDVIPADGLSQGNLYLLGLLVLGYDPAPPAIVCIEDLDRGIHPRMLRQARDLLYRLSYPDAFSLHREAVQVIATTHSPYLLDQFRDHPEEVVIAHKRGRAATFERLIDRPDLNELLQEGSLGEMWYAGILGGVPDEEIDIRPGKVRIEP